MNMARIGKLAGALTALGLAISASSASAFPFWSFGGGGGLGGDNMWTPFDGRFVLDPNGNSFMNFTANQQGGTTGTLFIQMDLDGYAYNAGNAVNTVQDGTPLGDFLFTMTYSGAEVTFFTLEESGTDVQVRVPNAASGFGELEYTNDTLTGANINELGALGLEQGALPNLNPRDDSDRGSVDGEIKGDVIVFATPNCTVLDAVSVSNEGSTPGCPSLGYLFDWFGPIDASFGGTASNPVEELLLTSSFTSTALPPSLGDPIPTGVISLFHVGSPSPCPSGYDPSSTDFLCNPTRANFSGTDAQYAALLVSQPGSINAVATAGVPAPSIAALLGIGLAGLGFARRRPKA